jgi:hypothetical protein
MATLSSILGSAYQGVQGPIGVQGVQGTIGIQGFSGIQGDLGVQGTSGEQGIQGVQGTIGTATTTIPQNSQTTGYTLVADDSSKHVAITTGGVTVPSGVFSAGDAVTIFNNSAAQQTITSGAGITMFLAGTATTGDRFLQQRGLATILCFDSNSFVISGAGMT